MPGHRMVARDLAGTGLLKAFGRTLMGLHLGHNYVLEFVSDWAESARRAALHRYRGRGTTPRIVAFVKRRFHR